MDIKEKDSLSPSCPRPGAPLVSPSDASEPPDLHQQGKKRSQYNPDDSLALPREILFVVVVCMAQFCTQIGLGQTMACLEVIGAYYDLTEPARLTWLMAGQSLTTGSFILFSGRLRHAYGHQHLLLLGFLWFSFWNMICGISVYANYFLFVFSRMMQAIGPVICLPTGMAFLAFLEAGYVSGYWKAMVFAIFVACSPSGSIMGSLSAAVFDRTWWPWTYWTLSIVLVVVSNAAKQRYQGIAASLVNTVVSYSMSFALGIAGTVEVHVDNGSLSPEDRSKGFRAGMLTGAGLARFGLCLSAVFLVKECFFESK